MAQPTLKPVIDAITGTLFVAEQRRIQTWIDQLAKKSQEIRKDKHYFGFLFGGIYYKPTNVALGHPFKPALHPSLYDEMAEFLADKTQLDNDRAFIGQALLALLQPCDSLQEMRDALPECLVPSIASFTGLPRSREEAYTLTPGSRAHRHYLKIRPRIEFYAATRLIY